MSVFVKNKGLQETLSCEQSYGQTRLFFTTICKMNTSIKLLCRISEMLEILEIGENYTKQHLLENIFEF